MNDKLTIGEAMQWLLDNPRRWNDGKMSPQTVTSKRHRFKMGKLRYDAKIKFIRDSGEFDEVIYFEFKNNSHEI